MYNIKIKLISQEIDEKGNGIYKFELEENITNGILDYDTHLIINNYEDIEKNVNIINEFVDFCGAKFYPSWQIYLKKENSKIYPYDYSGMSKEDAMNNAKELYNKYFE